MPHCWKSHVKAHFSNRTDPSKNTQFLLDLRTFLSKPVFDGEERAGCLLCLSSWCLVIVVWLFLTMPRVCLQFVIVVFPDHTHLIFSFNNTSTSLLLGRRQYYVKFMATQSFVLTTVLNLL